MKTTGLLKGQTKKDQEETLRAPGRSDLLKAQLCFITTIIKMNTCYSYWWKCTVLKFDLTGEESVVSWVHLWLVAEGYDLQLLYFLTEDLTCMLNTWSHIITSKLWDIIVKLFQLTYSQNVTTQIDLWGLVSMFWSNNWIFTIWPPTHGLVFIFRILPWNQWGPRTLNCALDWTLLR